MTKTTRTSGQSDKTDTSTKPSTATGPKPVVAVKPPVSPTAIKKPEDAAKSTVAGGADTASADNAKKTVPIGLQSVTKDKDKDKEKSSDKEKKKEKNKENKEKKEKGKKKEAKLDPVTGKPIEVDEADEDADLHQGDLIKAVAERASVRNNLARDVVIATLEELGLAVRSGREMKLPGLGRVKYQRVKQNVSSMVTVAKIRQDKDD